MKKVTFLLIFFAIWISALSAQQKLEVGIFGGVSSYFGEINQTKIFYSPKLASGGVLRYNFSDRMVGRMDFIYAKLSGNDADFKYEYQKLRAIKFSADIFDASFMMECNFFKFDKSSKANVFAPYLVGGVSILSGGGINGVTLALPVGFGVKFAPAKKITIGVEYTIRKSFSDLLDLIPEDRYNEANLFADKQRSDSFNKDWYSYAGVVITFNLFSKKFSCPAYSK